MSDAPHAEDGKTTVTGTVSAIIYQNEENGYTVCSLETEDDEITVTGSLPFLAEGERISAVGVWTNHPVYGPQFRAEFYEKSLPAEEADILRYLSTGNVKGIGPKTAARIVARFGPDTFDILQNHPDWLAEIPGISKKKAAEIRASFEQTAGVRSVMLFCRDYFSPAAAVRIYKRWGNAAVDRLREDPYLLCRELDGISFRHADKLALAIGIPPDDAERIRAGLCCTLDEAARKNGHTCLPEKELIRAGADLLGVGEDAVRTPLASMLQEKRLLSLTRENVTFVMLPQYFRAETYAAEKLLRLSRLCPRLAPGDAERLIWQIEAENHLEYAEMQRRAILGALGDGVMILTGGPGTGKTTVIRALISIFESLGLSCALAAPTGRAAKRMSEATSREAKTIHRLLEMEYAGEDDAAAYRFARGEKNTLDEDVVILDECSMIDVLLLEALLRAVKNGARVIFIGDAEQLPSVGAGNVLADLIAADCFPTFRLTEIFRQSQSSLIVTNSHAINEGRFPDITRKDGDFFFLPREDDEEIARTVTELYRTRLPRSYGDGVRQKIQVITPSHNGPAGTANLNRLLQEALNPPAPGKAERKRGDVLFREGDRVMQIRNDYSLTWTKDGRDGMGVFNGDIGVVESIDADAEAMTVLFDDRRAVYEFSMLDELEHAYAVTVHKSQGSEYPIVILPIADCPPMLRTRNLLYTAVTRAARMAILVGRRGVLAEMVQNERHALRMTNLAACLREACAP
jgi:exodeoxyribonuclease V alpha subunit